MGSSIVLRGELSEWRTERLQCRGGGVGGEEGGALVEGGVVHLWRGELFKWRGE